MIEVRKLLPYVQQHDEIDEDAVLQVYDQLVTKLVEQPHANKELLLECQTWLERHAPQSQTLVKIEVFFEKIRGLSDDSISYRPMVRIHKSVDIDLLGITGKNVRLKVEGTKEQNVPWTAVEGIFGCYVTGASRGYVGCIFIKFKRKIFACHFTKNRILIKDRFDQPLSFERTWDLLKTNLPEDLPALEMDAFPEIADTAELPRLTQEFLDRGGS